VIVLCRGGILAEEQYYSAKEVADILGVSTTTIYDWIKNGLIKAKPIKRLKKTYWQIPQSEVDRLKKELEIENTE